MSSNKIQDVLDARDAYLSWNVAQLKQLNEFYQQQMATDELCPLLMLALLYQVNNRHLPGYSGPDVPQGVYGYSPDEKVKQSARKLSSKFHYPEQAAIKNAVIQAIYIQQHLLEQDSICWLFYRSGLNDKQLAGLRQKTKKISQWINAKVKNVEVKLLSVEQFINNKPAIYKMDTLMYRDQFYAEALCLAGKYPLWWLVPPDKEQQYQAFVEKISTRRLVESHEYIDFGEPVSSADIFTRIKVCVGFAVQLMQSKSQNPELCFLYLLLVSHLVESSNQAQGVAFELKKKLYASEIEDYRRIKLIEISIDLMRNSYSAIQQLSQGFDLDRIVGALKPASIGLNTRWYQSFISHSESASRFTEVGKIINQIRNFKSLSKGLSVLFESLLEKYKQQVAVPDDPLLQKAQPVRKLLSESEQYVPLYNRRGDIRLVLDRLLLQHRLNQSGQAVWTLLINEYPGQSSENYQKVEGFNSLISLLAWSWLNRLVDQSTQVSIDSHNLDVKQVQARYLLEVIMQELDPQRISQVSEQQLKAPAQPLESLLFVNVEGDKKSDQTQDPLSRVVFSDKSKGEYEQLVVNSWGQVYGRHFSGNLGVLNSLCEWLALGHNSRPDTQHVLQDLLHISGYGVGQSTNIAQRLQDVYLELIDFFYPLQERPRRKPVRRFMPGRFILKLGEVFYLISADDKRFISAEIGQQRKILEFLQSPAKVFSRMAIERLAMPSAPLREIYRLNSPGVVQVFYKLANHNIQLWLLDEKGSLWKEQRWVTDPGDYVLHWVYLFRDFSKVVSKLNPGLGELKFEIRQLQTNALGINEFFSIEIDSLNKEKHYIEIKIGFMADISEPVGGLQMECEGKALIIEAQEAAPGSAGVSEAQLVQACVARIRQLNCAVDRRDFYITGIDAPLAFFGVSKADELQTLHLLRIKQGFEKKLNAQLMLQA